MKPTAAYVRALDATKAYHAAHKTFSGRFLFRYAHDVKLIIDVTGAKTMLDYGCGKGIQYEQPMEDGRMLVDFFGVDVTKYDPAWPPFAAEPTGKFDIVVCTQVLGSIPISDLGWVVDRLFSLANKAVFIGERLVPVRKRVHEHMKAEMPHNWTHEQWLAVLRRENSPVPGWLKTTGSDLSDKRVDQIA